VTRIPVSVFFALFTVSGFAGLIYQSIWSHYLKLFLGHAAYAQTLVLAIFMGGMALGSWLVSRYTARIRNMLVAYAAAELVIGLLAIAFHGVFRATTTWAFDTALPALGGVGVDLFKWTLASLLILPASIMLGTTFPLMSAGIVRLAPEGGGRALTMLYFTNSFGAALGVLASGFVLIGRLGLPGTILVAGVMNILLAAAVWLIARRLPPEPVSSASAPGAPAAAGRIDAFTTAILLLALLTGAASFIYEITWIRMLTQALGASTHSFEVMLAAFILAMSLGALWFRDRIGRVEDRVAWLAGLLVAKAAFAVSALWVYSWVLDLMKWLMESTARTDGGYVITTAGGMIAAMLVMFPAAFCAGMTLPLATHALTASGRGEASIGRVYSANTAGCILGAFFSTHVGMELLGVKGLTGFGALIDASVGLFLLAFFGERRKVLAALAGVIAATGVLFVVAPLELAKMTSGVYRYGQFIDMASTRLLSYSDGKTATIAVMDDGPVRSIRTNGKPDASIVMDPKLRASVDEYTMVMAAALPLAFRPDARTVANIGLGSGLTTHALLGSPRIEVLDSVEIERMIVEGAKHFRPRNARAFEDSRSRIHVEDAKTFFAAHQRRYDVIVSEPSNPWVSGISTLFSEEFYAHVRRYLKDDGVLVQWIQAYEIDLALLSSVFAALGSQMGDYAVYTTGPDLLVVATPARRLPEPSAELFTFPGMRADLALLGVKGMPDLEALRIGSRFALEPLFSAQRMPANSDFHPVLDQRAPLARFRRDHVSGLVNVRQEIAPVLAFFDRDGRMPRQHLESTGINRALAVDLATAAAQSLSVAMGGDPRAAALVQEPVRGSAMVVAGLAGDCGASADAWVSAVQVVAVAAVPFLRGADVAPYFEHVRKARCWKAVDADGRRRVELLEAINARDPQRVGPLAVAVLDAEGARLAPAERANYIGAAIAAGLVTGNLELARRARDRHVAGLPAAERASVPLNIALAHLAKFEGRR
jgi:spermidine synthase